MNNDVNSYDFSNWKNVISNYIFKSSCFFHLQQINRETFIDLGPIPFNLDFDFCRYYGTMELLDDGALIVYAYKDVGNYINI